MAEKIRVHEKALAHLSRGLYRSPAAALRELVSNAWDANATEVRIDTSAPEFTQLAVQDNGDGFTKAQFIRLMSGGIGNSEKQPDASLVNDRPLIGRLGIGMLGIAQICGGFTITSKTKKGEGFRARVVLYDLIRPALDRDDPKVVSKAEDSIKTVDIGEYTILDDFAPELFDVGTTILTDDVHPTFIKSFRETYTQPPMQWGRFISKSRRHHTIQELGDYWTLIWELAAASPVKYVDKDALPSGIAIADHRRLERFNLRVFVDGIELRKPVRLKDNKNGYTTRTIGPEEHRVFGTTVRFHGYIVVQEGLQLKPDELRGVMIRLNEVGIGLYDTSLLNYRYNEGPRARWITGEVYVDQGLGSALNIDRDSFNLFHPEYRVVQRRVHEILQQEIFPQVYKQINVRSNRRQKTISRQRHHLLDDVIREGAENVVVKRQQRSKSPAGAAATISEGPLVSEKSGKVEVQLPDADDLWVKKPFRELAVAIVAIFDLSMRERTQMKRREAFLERLFDLLAKW